MSDQNMLAAIAGCMDSLNVMGSGKACEEAAVRAFSISHRTLQQQFVRMVIIPILTKLAYDYAAGNCDGRNMAAGRLASRMLENLTDDDLYLPLI